MRRLLPLLLTVLLGPAVADAGETAALGAPPADVVERLGLDARYTKYLSAEGLPVVSSARVSDYALREAAYVVTQMLVGRQDVIDALVEARVRYVVIAHDELTTDIPEYGDLEPKRFWDKRARGLGASRERPAVSSGEENLLGYAGDPYATESIAVHEFAHAIHGLGLSRIDATFDARLRRTYAEARAEGLWDGTYAASNAEEYFAEGVQSWFGTNRADDAEHNHVDTRAELVTYDPRLAKLLVEVFPDNTWQYVEPSARKARGHLAGYDPLGAPRFAWPDDLVLWYARYVEQQKTGAGLPDAERLELTRLDGVRSRGTSVKSQLLIINRTAAALELAWIDFDGNRVPYQTIGAGRSADQSTFEGHVWTLKDATGAVVAACRAGKGHCRAIIESATAAVGPTK